MACGGTRGPRLRPRDEQRRHPLERPRQHRVAVALRRAMPQARRPPAKHLPALHDSPGSPAAPDRRPRLQRTLPVPPGGSGLCGGGFRRLLRALQRTLHRTRRDPGDPGRPSSRRSALPGPGHDLRKPARRLRCGRCGLDGRLLGAVAPTKHVSSCAPSNRTYGTSRTRRKRRSSLRSFPASSVR
jgi:hypothetical protein